MLYPQVKLPASLWNILIILLEERKEKQHNSQEAFFPFRVSLEVIMLEWGEGSLSLVT